MSLALPEQATRSRGVVPLEDFYAGVQDALLRLGWEERALIGAMEKRFHAVTEDGQDKVVTTSFNELSANVDLGWNRKAVFIPNLIPESVFDDDFCMKYAKQIETKAYSFFGLSPANLSFGLGDLVCCENFERPQMIVAKRKVGRINTVGGDYFSIPLPEPGIAFMSVSLRPDRCFTDNMLKPFDDLNIQNKALFWHALSNQSVYYNQLEKKWLSMVSVYSDEIDFIDFEFINPCRFQAAFVKFTREQDNGRVKCKEIGGNYV